MKFKVLSILIFFCFNSYAVIDDLHLDYESFEGPSRQAQSKVSCPKEALEKESPDFIFLGENHWDSLAQNFIINHIDLFKELGFEFFFAEYIESQDQHYIDRFYENPTQMNLNYLYSTFANPSDWGYSPEKYLRISLGVMASGMRLMGFDRRRDLELEKEDIQMAIRDRHMFKVAEEFVLNNPGKKAIFFNGWSHSFLNNSLAAPSVYERFIERFPGKKVLNLKRDYYEELSRQRMKIYQYSSQLSEGCEGEFLFYRDDEKFDFYIFEENQPLFPISESYVTDLT